MELSAAQLAALQTITVNANKVNTETLTVGQQLAAKVIAYNSAKGEVTLNINNNLLSTKTTIPMTVGQNLQLVVAQLGKELVLQLPQALIDKAITQKALRESLPQQQALSDTLKNLQQFVQQGKNSGISEKIIQYTQRFIQQIPGAKQLSNAQGLKDVIQRSGIFLENKLANINAAGSQKNISDDFKSFLLQLKSLLSNERNRTDVQSAVSTTQKNDISKSQQLTLDNKVIELAKQIKSEDNKTAAENKQVLNQQQTKLTNAEVKNVLQQALDKINQQQKTISQNLSRLLANSQLTSGNIQNPSTSNPPSSSGIVKENVAKPASIALKDALAFTSQSQRSAQTDINFSRLNNLMDLLDVLIKQVDAGISRTQLHQLNSLIEPETGKLNWSMEIPVKINEELHSIHLHLEKEQAANEDGESVLTVSIALDLDNLGPVYARITLIGENVGVVMWAEREDTYQLTQQNADELQSNLQKSGLKPETINFHHGQPPTHPVLNKTQQSGLLDVRA